MLVIKLSKEGYIPNQEISSRLFEHVGNTVVKVVCEVPYYDDVDNLENSICSYMNTFMPADLEVKTNHVTYNQSTGEDFKGKYIIELDFQVFI